MSPYWFVPDATQEVQTGMPSCMYLLSALGTALAGSWGVIVFLANKILTIKEQQINEGREREARLRQMLENIPPKTKGGTQ